MLTIGKLELLRVALLIGGLCIFATAPARADEPAPSERTLTFGKEVYRSANCIGCHKWHGDGGGGYGGLALSLRATTLDRPGFMEVVRCGRAGTHMVYHDTKAWDEGRCYGGTKRSDLDPTVFPSFGISLTEREIQSVTDYVIVVLRGKGEPTREQCIAFWGKDSERVCKPYPQAQ